MIEVKDLFFSYPRSNREAIRGIDFSIKRGEIFGFLGPSGAGKTTAQRILIGLLRGYRGSAQVMGRERSKWGREFFEEIGVAFESPNLYLKLTALENLTLLASYYQKRMHREEDLLERVGLFPDRHKRVEEYSKGMKMRLNFIRSILHDPHLLFLDEPTSGLDPANGKIIREMILEMQKEGKTIFLTTHNMIVADELCDRVAFLVQGTIPIIASPKELKDTYGRDLIEVEYIKKNTYQKSQFPLSSIGENRAFLEILKEYEIKRMHTQEATLEEIFLTITGRELL